MFQLQSGRVTLSPLYICSKDGHGGWTQGMLTLTLSLAAVAVVVVFLPALTTADETDFEYDYDPVSHIDYEIHANEAAAGVPPSFDHVDLGPPTSYHHDDLPPPDHDDLPPPDHDDSPNDEVDGDVVKDQWEHRIGDVVQGGYTVQEPDGTVHHVRYTENKKGGRGSQAAEDEEEEE